MAKARAQPIYKPQGRFRLLHYLAVRPRTTTELASLERKHLSSISRMLRELKEEGYVTAPPRKSRERYYEATREGYTYYALVSYQFR